MIIVNFDYKFFKNNRNTRLVLKSGDKVEIIKEGLNSDTPIVAIITSSDDGTQYSMDYPITGYYYSDLNSISTGDEEDIVMEVGSGNLEDIFNRGDVLRVITKDNTTYLIMVDEISERELVSTVSINESISSVSEHYEDFGKIFDLKDVKMVLRSRSKNDSKILSELKEKPRPELSSEEMGFIEKSYGNISRNPKICELLEKLPKSIDNRYFLIINYLDNTITYKDVNGNLLYNVDFKETSLVRAIYNLLRCLKKN